MTQLIAHATLDGAPSRTIVREVLAVLVVYERRMQDIACWPTLLSWLNAHKGDPANEFRLAHVLVYDNSPNPQRHGKVPDERLTWMHDPENGGTRAAYLHATSLAVETGYPWLLLLDHDTQLPADFLALANQAHANDTCVDIYAWLPRVMSGPRCISPAVLRIDGSVRPMSATGGSIEQGLCITAVASGSLLKTSRMKLLPSPPVAMWLDGVDHWLFLHLHRQGGRVGFFDAALEHELSVMDYASLSPRRVQSMLSAQAAMLHVLPFKARLVYPLRLTWFLLKLSVANPKTALAWLRLSLFGKDQDA